MHDLRRSALRLATERQPRAIRRPTGPDGAPLPIRQVFASHVFTLERMREHLPAEVVRRFQAAVEHGEELSADLADRIAQGALEWAVERGATHFAHWFQPMTGTTAEKHDAFLAFDDDRPISRFTGTQLTRSEPDASSFPSGGMRSTFEARGYTVWDPASPLFIMERTNGATLCIPSCFFSYDGHALDKKTPLLRSMDALDRQLARLWGLLGEPVPGRFHVTAGPEQEYFLVDRAWVAARPDLLLAGRALVGAPPPKGQTLEDHYFGSIPSRVLAFMHELELELYKVGVPAQTRHNEVAPSQFEIAVHYEDANLAADHNQLVMELVRKVAGRHALTALLHEKPFPGINGSGKHLNWSLADATGANLLAPGETPEQNLRFLAILAAILLGVHRHAAPLRAAIASHGNDFRLGANEAPPAILSVFLGSRLSELCEALADGRAVGGNGAAALLESGLRHLPRIRRDDTDRNRTSPFAFTGDKFEFRAVGANASISFPLTALNTAVADGLDALSARIEALDDRNPEAILGVIGELLRESRPVRFEGNNYDAAWVARAEARGLPHLRDTPAALAALGAPEVRELFQRHGVLRPAELTSRVAIKTERYLTTVEVELDVLGDLVSQAVLPAARAEIAARSEAHGALHALGIEPHEAERAELKRLIDAVAALHAGWRKLSEAGPRLAALDPAERARAVAAEVVPGIEAMRTACATVEELVADDRWPLPRLREILFQNG